MDEVSWRQVLVVLCFIPSRPIGRKGVRRADRDFFHIGKVHCTEVPLNRPKISLRDLNAVARNSLKLIAGSFRTGVFYFFTEASGVA